jgi:hypothetical protein
MMNEIASIVIHCPVEEVYRFLAIHKIASSTILI